MLVLTLIVFGVMFWLDSYTCNGCSQEVPDFTDLNINQLDVAFDKFDLRYEVIDSTYLPNKDPNLVYDQDPLPGTRVKENRKIYLSVTCNNIPMVFFPNIIYQKGVFEEEYSVRQATTILNFSDLEVGEITTRPDISTNVLEAHLDGQAIGNGDKVPRGSEIDLVVGVKSDSKVYDIPNLIGLTLEEAELALSEASLNTGSVEYDGEISDSTKALIYKQDPDTRFNKGLNLGHFIDLWIIDYEKFERDSLKNNKKELL